MAGTELFFVVDDAMKSMALAAGFKARSLDDVEPCPLHVGDFFVEPSLPGHAFKVVSRAYMPASDDRLAHWAIALARTDEDPFGQIAR